MRSYRGLASAILASVVGVLLLACGPGSSGETFSDRATSSGIELRVVDATFGASESLLVFAWTIIDEEAVLALLDDRTRAGGEILAVAPARDGFEGPFAGPRGPVRLESGGQVQVGLPPLADPEGYEGTIRITVSAVDIVTAASPSRVDGQWVIEIEGPTVRPTGQD